MFIFIISIIDKINFKLKIIASIKPSRHNPADLSKAFMYSYHSVKTLIGEINQRTKTNINVHIDVQFLSKLLCNSFIHEKMLFLTIEKLL